MQSLLIQEEIKKHQTLSYEIYSNEEESITIPNKQQFIDHIFTDRIQDRNKFHDDSLLLKFKTNDGKEFKVCIWELNYSTTESIQFYGYCGYRYYGSGLYSDKEGYGFRLIEGKIYFNCDGKARKSILQVMPEETFHR